MIRNFQTLPIEYNIWLFFRHIVDIILLNDFVSYCLFAFSHCTFPPSHSVPLHILRWTAGWTLVFFNLWVKVDAHRVVKDYAWFWGDCFFRSMSGIVFDGVFEMAPHPMYSVGYGRSPFLLPNSGRFRLIGFVWSRVFAAGYYGLSLIVASHTVLFVSLAAHACQFAFLVFFENPRKRFVCPVRLLKVGF